MSITVSEIGVDNSSAHAFVFYNALWQPYDTVALAFGNWSGLNIAHYGIDASRISTTTRYKATAPDAMMANYATGPALYFDIWSLDSSTWAASTVRTFVRTGLQSLILPQALPGAYNGLTIGNQIATTGFINSTTGTNTYIGANAHQADAYFDGGLLVLTSGTGAGQWRIITYTGTVGHYTHTAWAVNPDSTTLCEIRAVGAGGGTSRNITIIQE